MPKLIIFDYYGTLVKADVNDRVFRVGTGELLEHYNESHKVIFSDGDEDVIRRDLEEAGFDVYFDHIYDIRDCVSESYYTMQDEFFREQLLKRGRGNIKHLSRALDDFSLVLEEAVFIGDNYQGRDKKSANIHRVRFFHVPQFRENPAGDVWFDSHVIYDDSLKFRFDSLIGKLEV